MKKNYSLILVAFLCMCFSSFAQYDVDFEDDTKTAYASNTVTLNGINWNMTNALIGTSASDFKNGAHSARFRGRNGSGITMLANKTNGIGTISFEYRIFGSDPSSSQQPWAVEYSTNNGANWTQAGSDFTATSTVQTFSSVVNVPGNIRVRIVIASSPGTSGDRRMNVDDISITDNASTNTSVEFASVSYTAGENNASVDICVDITNASTTNATDVDVVLTSGTAPHLTYTTQTLTFLANDSTQQCATIAISNNTNCGDSNDYTFELQSISGGDSAVIGVDDTTTLTVNDDEGSIGPFSTLSFEVTDDWGYATTGGTVNSITNKFFGTQSYELTGANRLVTDNIDISTYTNVSLSVAFAAVGVDSGEDLFLDISYDNAATWTGTGSIKLVDGFSNADIDIGNTNASNPTTVATNPWTVAIDPSETQIRVRLRVGGLDAGEYYYVDDIILSGDTCVTICTPTHSVSSFTPTSGPEGTEVTINGSGFTNATEIEFNGVPANETFIDANTMTVIVPVGATTGEITIIENSCDINTADFTLINNNGNCGSLTDLIMTEIFDNNGGSLGYIEVYNGTGATINLTNYFVRRYGSNANFIANDFTDYFFAPEATTITDGQVIYGKISSDADVATPDFSFGNAGFSGINGDDIFELRDNTGVIDVYIVPNSNIGYTALRNTNTAGPNTTSNPSDWTHNTTESIADLGSFPYVALSNFPVINASPTNVTSCANQAVFSAMATPGDGGPLTYQWFYNNGSALGWTAVASGDFPLTTITGEASNQLTLGTGFANYNGYQFYCLVTESGSCSTASDAAQLKLDVAIWSSSAWSTLPTINTIVIINDDYDTNIGGPNVEISFAACQLLVNAGNELIIRNNDYVLVQNNLTVNGNIVVETDGSFVQVNDLGIVNGDVLTTRNKITVDKETAPLATYQEYTYWSAPVDGETIGNGLNEADPNRIFWFNAQNYLDACAETANNDVLVCDDGFGNSLQDDIDDLAPYDWQSEALGSTMTPGLGYAATHNSIGFNPSQFIYIFEGPFNNGLIEVDLYRNDAEMADTNWNFIGNPYPSAISADDFLTLHTYNVTTNPTGVIDGAIYFWSHNTAADGTTNGNQVLNYSQSDYAVINGTGETAAGDGLPVDRFIPSGQGFFVSMHNDAASTVESGTIRTTTIAFNNSMRVTGNNAQFFRNDNSSSSNKIRLNLTTDNGVFNQILIGYVDGATDGNDGTYYDAHKNLSASTNSIVYSLLEDSSDDTKFGIQGKDPNNLAIDEIIPLGFYTSIDEATLYTLSIADLEGEFMTENTVYLKDKLLGVVHNLSENDYTFTSEIGEFNDRFDIVFQAEALSVNENDIPSDDLSIIELGDGDVEFSVGNSLIIKHVEIIDIVGRTIYKLEGNNSTEVFDLSRLSQAAYIAKVTLSNGQIITKKTIKRY